jgi:multidrug efflux system membrane fusion protein
MNIRFPQFSGTFPPAAQDIPAAIRRANSRTRLVIGAAAAAGAIAIAWGLAWILAPAPPSERPPAPVKVAEIRRANVTVVEHTLGTVVANATVQVTARVDGQLMSAGFKEGDMVRAGQSIFRIDPRPFQAALEQARATLAKDEAQLKNAQNDKARYDTLFKAGAASSQQRDQADASAKSLAATVQADRAALNMAKLNLGYTDIRSPIDGKTGPILIQPGNLVTANGSNPLVVITQVRPVKVSFSLPQSDLPRIQERARQHALMASVDVHDASGKRITAPVDFIGNAVSNTTGTIELRATFPNDDLKLVPGQLIDVAVGLNTLANALVAPREAVNVGPDGRYVYVVDANGVAQLRKVEVLFDGGGPIAVAGHLRAGDRVITEGQLRVEPGKPVRIVGDRAPPSAGGEAAAK